MSDSHPEQVPLEADTVLAAGNVAEPSWLLCPLSRDSQVTRTALLSARLLACHTVTLDPRESHSIPLAQVTCRPAITGNIGFSCPSS